MLSKLVGIDLVLEMIKLGVVTRPVWCRFLESPKVVEVDVGRPAEIRCNVDAVPLTASTITWRREGYDLGKEGRLVMSFSSSCF
jgi:hypothetical protein